MQKRISYELAKTFNKLGYDIETSYLYLNIHNGLKTVKGDINKPIGEQIYHTGDLVKQDIEWGIMYPSPYWIPAPFIFDIVKWLENTFNIKIITNYIKNKGWEFDIIYPEYFINLELNKENKNNIFNSLEDIYDSNKTYYITLETCYENALTKIAKLSETNNWITKIYKTL